MTSRARCGLTICMSNPARTPERMDTTANILPPGAPPGCAPCSGSVTVAYSIINDKEWGATNPLRYEHNGLKAHTVGTYDAFERLERFREELERLREIVCAQDAEAIDAVLSESQNKKVSDGLGNAASTTP